MRYFFVFGALLFIYVSAHTNELRDIRDTLGREGIHNTPERLLAYLEQEPDDTELVEQVIRSIALQLERWRVDTDQFLRQLEKEPDNFAALQKAAVAMKESGVFFGFDLGLDREELLSASFAAKEYQELDAIVAELDHAVDEFRFEDASVLISNAVSIGQGRFLTTYGTPAQDEANAISTEISLISERFGMLYKRQLLPLAKRADSVIDENNVTAIENLANEINSVGLEFSRLITDLERVTDQVSVLQNTLGKNITYPELLIRIIGKDYYTTSSLANILEDTLAREMEIILSKQAIAFQNHFEFMQKAMDDLQITSALSESSLARALASSLVRNAQFIVPINDELTIPVIESEIPQNLEQARTLLHYYTSHSAIEFVRQILSASTNFASLIDAQSESGTVQVSGFFDDQESAYQQYLGTWNVEESEIIALNTRIDSDIVSSIVNQTNDAVESFLSVSREYSAELYNSYFAEIVDMYRLLVDETEGVINTIRPLIYSANLEADFADETVLSKKYPQEAILILNETIPTVDMLLGMLFDFEPLYRSLRTAATLNINNTFETFLMEVVNISNTLRLMQSDAEQNIAEAIRLRQDGDSIRLQAEEALLRNEGRLADELWERARVNYLDSLALREDEQFREEIGQASTRIRNRILEIEHASVVREVRDFINRSRRAIAVQDIDEAYTLITQAAELWAITNIDPNPEIVQQQEYIELVLTFDQVYNLGTTNPLYSVLSGYLDSASKNIEQINQLIRAGSVEESELLVTRTRDIIQNVIDVQPFNTEARALNLRLIEAADSDEAQSIIEELFASASRATESEPRQSLSDFYAIRILRPDYPGLEERIEIIETELGLRIVAPDQVDQQQSSRLLEQAQALINTGDRNRAAAAEVLLQEALTFNPNDNSVQSALDQLRIDIGSNAQANLSINDDQLLRRAETLFVQGDIAQTFAILENLWSAPLNRNYPPLVALRNQVISRLGI